MLFRSVERCRKRIQLVVDCDSQCLEDPGGGVDARGWTEADGNYRGDERGKALRCVDRLEIAPSDDSRSDPRRMRLFPIHLEYSRDLGRVEASEQRGGRLTARCVETEVERASGADPESTRVVGELVRGEPEVEEDAIRCGNPRGLRGCGDLCVAPLIGLQAPSDVRKSDRKSTRLNSSHTDISRMPSSA